MDVAHEGVTGIGPGQHVGNLVERDHGVLKGPGLLRRHEILQDLLRLSECAVHSRAHLVRSHFRESKIQTRHAGHGSQEATTPNLRLYVAHMQRTESGSEVRLRPIGMGAGSGVRHLNHGSFGAVLNEVLDLQTAWKRKFEADPGRFVWRDLRYAMDRPATPSASSSAPTPLAWSPCVTQLPESPRSFGRSSHCSSPATSCSPPLTTTTQCVRSFASPPSEPGAEVVVARVPFPIDGPSR